MSVKFDPLTYVREIEKAAEAGGWTLQYLSPCASGPRPWLQRTATANAPRIYISAGIHGDEYAGPIAVLEMLRHPDFFSGFHTTLFPILNPDGLAKGIRENADGIDLNRDYRDPKSSEIASHIAALQTLDRFDGAMFLHEDFEGIGAYLFELNDSDHPGLGREMIDSMREHVPIDERPEIDEFPADFGIISRNKIVALKGPIEDRPDWPEAIYLSVHHTQVAYTTETPIPFPLDQRVKAQIAAVETLLEALAS